ncbi:MAG TPA: gamma-glutamyl-gamma-aminobutyrate hydrolase family protein [Vicinamibacterales bacterium]|jgi:putative glutamine amidotransferase|nr:gamma-glutamyl-gamma-aminobutyrate hydrolase family protein [Vicinamibacterales bacterium]
MSGGKPVIGVGWPKPDYLEALTRADADPFVIAPDRDAISTVLDRCDGLLLTGGADVEPRRYGESIRYDNLKLDPTRDEYEIALIQAALARDVPILAICRGIQALNVAAGGTLVQDIPSEIATPISHKGDRPEAAPAHDVTIHAGTHAARLLEARLDGDGRVAVNSRHHQAVKNVAPGLVVSAVAPDGIVEGLEQPSATFCVAVQWHPENFWSTGEFAELFRGLVNAAGGRR